MALRGGIDLGGTKILAVILDDANTIVGRARSATPTSGGPARVTEALASTLREAARAAGVGSEELRGVGIGSPGAIDARAGTVSRAGNLPDWEAPFPLAPLLARALRTQVVLGNDVGVALDAEAALGLGQRHRSFLGVFWGTGIGGGVVLDGRRWHGRGASGEIGHVTVRPGGARCACGRRGCVEAYAGRRSMEARARRAHRRGVETRLFEWMEQAERTRLTSGIWEKALERRDRLAQRLVRRAIDALALGIAGAVNLLDVEAVAVGGGLGVRLGPRLLPRIRARVRRSLFLPQRPPELHVAALGDDAGALGAALLVPLTSAKRAPRTEKPSRSRRVVR